MNPDIPDIELSHARFAAFLKHAVVCEGCEALIRHGLSVCPQCEAYRFDPDRDRVGREAAKVVGEMQRGRTVAVSIGMHGWIESIQWRISPGDKDAITRAELEAKP